MEDGESESLREHDGPVTADRAQSYDDCDVSLATKQTSDAAAQSESEARRRNQADAAPLKQESRVIRMRPTDSVDRLVRPDDKSTGPATERYVATQDAVGLLIRLRRQELSRDRAMSLRDRVNYERQDCKHKMRHLDDSQQELMEAMADVLSAGTLDQSMPRLHRLFDKARADKKELDIRAEVLSKLEYKLTRFEFSMRNKERQLTEHLIVALRQLGVGSSVDLAVDVPESLSDDLSTTSDLVTIEQTSLTQGPSTLESYYDKSGNVRIMQDRLHDLEAEYLSTRADRNFQQDQGLNLEVADEQYDLNYSAARKCAEDELQDAVLARNDALLACMEEGVDPDKAVQTNSVDPEDQEEGADDEVEGAPLTPSSARQAPSATGLANGYRSAIKSPRRTAEESRQRDSSSSIRTQGFENGALIDWVHSWMADTKDDVSEQCIPSTLSNEQTLPSHEQRSLSISSGSLLDEQGTRPNIQIGRLPHLRSSEVPQRPRAVTDAEYGHFKRPSIHSRSSSDSIVSSLNVTEEELAQFISALKSGDLVVSRLSAGDGFEKRRKTSW